MKNTGFFWHVHHDILLEHCYDYKKRVNYIKSAKPKEEREVRLCLFKPVKSELPKKLEETRKEYEIKRKRCEENIDRTKICTCSAARQEFSSEFRINKDKIEALHVKECPNCPWDGKTIFPKEKEK